MKYRILNAAILGLVLSVSGFANASLTIDPSVNGSNCCNFGERGYWFESPVDFNLDSLWLNTSQGLSTSYNAEVLLFNSTPPEFNASTTDFVSLGAYSNISGVFDVNFSFSSGDIIGLLAWDNNSSTTPYSSESSQTLFTSSTNLTRLVRQTLVSGSAVSSEANVSNIGAIGFEYSASKIPEPSTIAILALGIMGLASRRFKKII